MAKQLLKVFCDIQKVDEENRVVSGYCSTEMKDSQGDIITTDAMKNAFPEYMKFANVREMHTDSAVGIVEKYSFDENGTFVEVKVVDDDAWKKVKEKVYKGFSIGGAALKKIGSTITELLLIEISLVDRPANPGALFTEYKSETIDSLSDEFLTFAKRNDEKIPDFEEVENVDKNQQLIDEIEKSGVSFDEILELIQLKKSETEKQKEEELNKKMEALLKKGFYDVQDVLSAVNTLTWVLDSQEWEAKWENDENSEILLNIREHILSLVELAKQLLDNEIKDLTPEPQILQLKESINEMVEYSKTVEKMNKNRDVSNDESESEDLKKSISVKDVELQDLKKSIGVKDDEIKTLKEENDYLRKNATFDTKEEVKNFEKKVSSFETVKNKDEIKKSIDEEIDKVSEEIKKSDGVKLVELKNKLSALKLRKSQMLVFS